MKVEQEAPCKILKETTGKRQQKVSPQSGCQILPQAKAGRPRRTTRKVTWADKVNVLIFYILPLSSLFLNLSVTANFILQISSPRPKLFQPFALIPRAKSPWQQYSSSSLFLSPGKIYDNHSGASPSSSLRQNQWSQAVIFPAPLHPRPLDEIHSLQL